MTARAIGVACAAICLGAVAPPGGGRGRRITVTGNGAVTGTPNELQLSLKANARRLRSARRSTARTAMIAVRDALTAGASPGRYADTLACRAAGVQPQNMISVNTVSESLTAELHHLATAGQTITTRSRRAGTR